MRLRPDITSLLELARDLLQNEFRDEGSFETRRYETFMMANALTIAARQVEGGTAPDAEEREALQALIGDPASNQSLEILNRQFAAQIRNGDFDPDTAGYGDAWKFLEKSARQNVLEYNPKYLNDLGDT